MKVDTLYEQWKDIDGYEGLYQVSNFGRVKSMRNKSSPFLKSRIDRYGYPTVGLTINGITKRKKLHRLIAQAFIPNTENLKEIDHIDGDRGNFNISNLRWCTRKDNMNNIITKERMSISKKGRKLEKCAIIKLKLSVSKKVAVFTKEGVEIERFESATEASQKYSICDNWIRRVCRGELKSAKGLIFKYV